MTLFSTARVLAASLALLIAGCAVNGVSRVAPSASGAIETPAGTRAESVFACAERSVTALHAKNAFWNTRITRRDAGSGTLETGDFPDDNIGGFRIRLRYPAGGDRIAIEVKGAGPYFTDLGVDRALSDFKAQYAACPAAP